MSHREDRFVSGQGQNLYEQCWLPKSDSRAVVVAVHGLIEHGGRFEAAAKLLNQHGYAVYAMDLRGHGRSDGPRCFVGSFGDYLDDLDGFLQRVRDRESGKPLFLLGNSMGGLIVAVWAITRQADVAGLILTGPLLGVPKHLFPILRRWASVVSTLAPHLRLTRVHFPWLSRDPAVIVRFREDPLVFQGRFPARTGAEILRAIRLVADRAFAVRWPLLILHGSDDRLCDPEGSRQLWQHADSRDKTIRIYEGFYHEVLDEPERERVLEDLTSWLDRRA